MSVPPLERARLALRRLGALVGDPFLQRDHNEVYPRQGFDKDVAHELRIMLEAMEEVFVGDEMAIKGLLAGKAMAELSTQPRIPVQTTARRARGVPFDDHGEEEDEEDDDE